MNRLVKLGIVVLALGGLVAGGVMGFRVYLRHRHRPTFHEVQITRGEIISVVNSTGTIQPVLRVQVGTFVSGPIKELLVDFNDNVKKDQLLARIDPRIYEAAVARDEASLAAAKAEVDRVDALLQPAKKDEDRAQQLKKINEDYLSASAWDQYQFNRKALEAQLEVALAAVKQAKASLDNSQANLKYTEIVSPRDGIVIDRKIDEGQTLAAQFTTPELFIVAPEMEKRMYVYASVDEADIGLIRSAQEHHAPVEFTVDAYPEDLFKGHIEEIRKNPTTTENVVTYPVVVESPNPDMKLLPGMTASLSFQVGKKENVLKIPNAALRFYPKPEHVREEDRSILEGAAEEDKKDDEENEDTTDRRSAAEKAEAGRNRSRRHVWVVEGELLRAVPVTTGLSDNKFTELVKGDLKEGQSLVTRVDVP